MELGRFLQGYYNDSKKFYFDKATSSPECITKMDEIGMTDRGWIDDFILHYENATGHLKGGRHFIILMTTIIWYWKHYLHAILW